MSIRIAGATNFRSLGGLPAADGRRIRPHALMRADRLSGLSADDWGALGRAGLTTICDLRSEEERGEHPNNPPPHLGVLELRFGIRNDLRADPALARLIASDPTARGSERASASTPALIAASRRPMVSMSRFFCITGSLRFICDRDAIVATLRATVLPPWWAPTRCGETLHRMGDPQSEVPAEEASGAAARPRKAACKTAPDSRGSACAISMGTTRLQSCASSRSVESGLCIRRISG